MVAIAPFAIVLGAAAAAGLLFYGLWDRISARLVWFTRFFGPDLERANLKIKSEQLLIAIVGMSLTIWLFVILFFHAGIALAGGLLAALLVVNFLLCRMWLRGRVAKRKAAFNGQIEMVLRMISNALRVGLGMRQALVLVTEELEEPARGEFMRVFAQTNIGVPISDALDALVMRMPSDELRMMVDAIRVQSQTGGNLAKIMDHLAHTIKARRAVRRKIKALTGEATAGAWVLGSLPVLVGGIIMLTQPPMREAMIATGVGHVGLILFCVLEILGIITLVKLLDFEV